jgi:GT2 family glycosyltransferase
MWIGKILGIISQSLTGELAMIGIIIPTKDNTKEFFDCIKSIGEHTVEEYKVYVADTGSSQDVKDASVAKLTEELGDKFKFIEYDYYNFAKINNDVVRNHLDDDIDILVFCNNDITIMSKGLIDRMAKAIIENPNFVGTCGCRLLYPNGTIQHDGQLIRIPPKLNGMITMSHANVGKNPTTIPKMKPTIVHGNTFALVATERELFERLGMLSEDYIECFEDVQYNLACKLEKRTNVMLESNYWAFHHESLSRGQGAEAIAKLRKDYPKICNYIAKNYKGLTCN